MSRDFIDKDRFKTAIKQVSQLAKQDPEAFHLALIAYDRLGIDDTNCDELSDYIYGSIQVMNQNEESIYSDRILEQCNYIAKLIENRYTYT